MKELSVLGLQPDILQHVCNIYLQYMLEECSAKKKKNLKSLQKVTPDFNVIGSSYIKTGLYSREYWLLIWYKQFTLKLVDQLRSIQKYTINFCKSQYLLFSPSRTQILLTWWTKTVPSSSSWQIFHGLAFPALKTLIKTADCPAGYNFLIRRIFISYVTS